MFFFLSVDSKENSSLISVVINVFLNPLRKELWNGLFRLEYAATSLTLLWDGSVLYKAYAHLVLLRVQHSKRLVCVWTMQVSSRLYFGLLRTVVLSSYISVSEEVTVFIFRAEVIGMQRKDDTSQRRRKPHSVCTWSPTDKNIEDIWRRTSTW
jgi:hypothetical protein